jgi:uncharacterized protein (UPF0335 family)
MSEHGGIVADRLRSIVERIARLEEEKSVLAADIRNPVYELRGWRCVWPQQGKDA